MHEKKYPLRWLLHLGFIYSSLAVFTAPSATAMQYRHGVVPPPSYFAHHHSLTLMTFCLGSLGFVVYRSWRQPGRYSPGAGLLGHAVVADDSVEPAPGIGILCGIVRIQRGRDAPLVLERGRKQENKEWSHHFQALALKISGLAVCTDDVWLRLAAARASAAQPRRPFSAVGMHKV